MSQRIHIAASELERLRDLVDQHIEGRDGPTAERLGEELDRATVVQDGEVPADVVTMNSQVTFEDERTGTVREVLLVYPSEAIASSGHVSVLAPIGAALIGLRVGDCIEWPLPGGRTARIRIRAVRQPASHAAQVVA